MIKNAFFPRFQFWYNFPHIFLSLLHISFVSFLYFSITYTFSFIFYFYIPFISHSSPNSISYFLPTCVYT